MSKLISLNFGQAGIQIGSTIWERLCIEHAVSPDGVPLDPSLYTSDENNASAMFDMGNSGNYIPRAVFIDSEPSVIDDLMTGAYRQLFNGNLMIRGEEDAANNYARGSYTIGKKMIQNVTNRIRKLAEATDNLRGFFIFNSSGGGTGSGLSPLVILSLLKDYSKAVRNNFSIVPGVSLTSAVVEPYNMCLQNFAMVETADVNFLFENETMFDVCSKKLFVNSPTFGHLNRVFAMVFSCISSPMRYSSLLRSAMDDLVTNLIPYPRIHYPVVRFAPVNHESKVSYEKITTYELTKELFSKETQSLKIDTNKGLFISMVLNYQGIVQAKDIYKYIDEVRSFHNHKFVEWSPTGFKIGICKQIPSPTPMLPVALSEQFGTMLLNSTAISQFFKTLALKFDLLHSRKCFVQWYLGEGMEDVEFEEARDELDMVIGDLKEISMSEAELMKFVDDPTKLNRMYHV